MSVRNMVNIQLEKGLNGNVKVFNMGVAHILAYFRSTVTWTVTNGIHHIEM